MFRQFRRLAMRQLEHVAVEFCDSPWFRLAVVALLVCVLLPFPGRGA